MRTTQGISGGQPQDSRVIKEVARLLYIYLEMNLKGAGITFGILPFSRQE